MIEFKNINKTYRNNSYKTLNCVNFNIDKNEIVCLLGPNGAGKTTLIKCLSGLIIPDSGEIYINKKKISYTNNNYMNDISVVLDGGRNLYWRIDVLSNLYYIGALKCKNRTYINNSIKKYADLFDIKDYLNKQVRKLSLGQKQKVAIFAAILTEPKILILDEPSNALDIESKDILIKLLLKIKRNYGTTILIASHDVDFVRQIVDKFIIFNKGQVKEIMNNNNLSNEIIQNKYYKIIENK